MVVWDEQLHMYILSILILWSYHAFSLLFLISPVSRLKVEYCAAKKSRINTHAFKKFNNYCEYFYTLDSIPHAYTWINTTVTYCGVMLIY